MKLTVKTMAWVAALSGFVMAANAQTVVWSNNFDSYPLSPFGSTYNDASGGNVTATIVSPGAGGAGQALQLSGNITNGVTENAGVNSPLYTASNNTDADLSDYTLSFDLAITHGANSGVGVTLNIFGGAAQANGSSYAVPISENTVGGGFQHYSVNMGTLPTGYEIGALVPTSSQYQFQLLFLGYNASVTATPETIELDNLQITVVPSTFANPPPSGTNTGPFYVNPPIYADYPDPDIIRVSNDFYFSTTTFIDVPGLTILHSQDLVHWEIVTRLVPQLTGSPDYNITNGVQDYRNGIFASSLRYYNGTFYCVETPNGQNTIIFYSTNIAGPWQSNLLSYSAFDPGLYIENGVGYIATAGGWQSNTTFLTLNSSFSEVVASTTITNGLGLEGSHVVKVNGYYYIFNSQPATGSLYVSRATSLFGPYTFMYSLNNNTGGHQGAIVDMPDGSYYGFVMQDCGAIGRMTYISPIFWSNGWPVWGTSSAPRQVPAIAPIPIAGKPAYTIPTSGDFSSPTLGLQWQWNHNPDNTRWSLTAQPGCLRLMPTGATNFWYARNTLIQKGQGPWSGAEVKFDLSHLQPGDICGFGTLGKTNGNISVTCGSPGSFTLSMNVIVPIDTTDTNLVDTTLATAPFTGTMIYLRTGLDFIQNLGTLLYSADAITWTQLGGRFNLAYDWATGTFQGEQFAIFCYNPSPGTGYLDVDWFRFTPPPFINRIIQSPNSSMTLYVANTPGSTNIVQATTNLDAWQNIFTNLADGNGFWQFTDTNTSLLPARFYRSYTP
ncbi:MAG: glycoside hydrolase 43 family protein [Limisphaerales bacterium]